MKAQLLLSLALLAVVTGSAGEALAGVTSSSARSVSVPASRTYSPARPSHAGAAAKPSTASKQQSTATPSASKPSVAAAPATPSTSQQHSSGSFWTPLLIGYMLAPSSSHANPPSAPKSPANSSPASIPPGQAATAPAEAAHLPIEQKTGPFTIDIPGRELLDENCHVRQGAKDFIKGAKIEKSVLFLTLPDGGRCEDSRVRLRADVAPAILVRSENGSVQLIRMVGQP